MSDNVIPKFKMTDIMSDIAKTYTSTIDIFIHHNVFAHNTTKFIRIIYLIVIVISILNSILAV